jgi:iron complex outermembrane recepter protein
MRYRHVLRFSVGAVAMLSAPALTQAQDTQQSDEGKLREIVVTAQKRAESVQNTPLSVGVVTGDDIAKKAQSTLDAVLRDVPSVEVQALAQGDQVYIRGVGSSIDPGIADPAVAMMVDGVYNGRTEAVSSAAYDIDRIEVLRGPQGTLYGRNASGGSMNVITANPRLNEPFSGYVRGSLGTYNEKRVEGAVNVATSDRLAFRVAGFREKRDGYVDDGSYDADAWGLRAKMLAKPTDWLTLLAKVDVYRQNSLGANTVPVPGSAGNLTFPPPYFFTTDASGQTVPRFPNGWVQRDPGNPLSNDPEHQPGYVKRHYESYQVQADADLGFATLTVLPAYSSNYNLLVSSFLFGSVLPGVGPTYTLNSNYDAQGVATKYTSIETRLTSNGHGPLKYILGFYYLHTEGGAPLTPTTFTATDGTTGLYTQTYLPGHTIAGFGQVTYAFTHRFRLTGGLRVSQDKNAYSYGYTFGTAATGTIDYSNTQTSTQYKVGVEYDLAEKSMAYAHVSTGFKQGGISPTIPSIPFLPEHLTAFELGVKNRFFDNHLQLNGALFHYNYRNYQYGTLQTLEIGTTGQTGSFPTILNAGPTHINGGEVELDAVPWHRAHLRASLTYLDAKYGNAILPNNPFVNQGNFQLQGHQIQNAPKWASNLSFEQGFKLGEGVLTAGASTHLTTGYFVTAEQYIPGAWQQGYSRSDLSLRYEQGRYSLSGVVHNVENQVQTTYVFPAYRRFISDPRTFVATLGIKF